MTKSRGARFTDGPQGLVLRAQCGGQDANAHPGATDPGSPEPEYVPCQEERRYDVTRGQLEAYVNGAPLAEIWPDPDPYLAEPLCDRHRSAAS